MIIKDKRDIHSLKADDLVDMECEYCHKLFQRPQKYLKSLIKRGLDWMKYCSKECQSKDKETGVICQCDNCDIEFYRSKSQAYDKRKKSNHTFCSSSCAASYNNSHNHTRKFGPAKSRTCKYCPAIIGNKRRVCDECKKRRQEEAMIITTKRQEERIKKETKTCKVCGAKTYGRGNLCLKHITTDTDEYTLKEIKCESIHKSNRYTNIRSRSRIIAESYGMLNECELCGYSKMVVCCHIKSISSFDEDTKIKVINDPSNLIGLCPNCHWELDHNMLSDVNKERLKEMLASRTLMPMYQAAMKLSSENTQ